MMLSLCHILICCLFFFWIICPKYLTFSLGCFPFLSFKCSFIIIYNIHYLPLFWFYFSYALKIHMINLWYLFYLTFFFSFFPLCFSFLGSIYSLLRALYCVFHWIYSHLLLWYIYIYLNIYLYIFMLFLRWIYVLPQCFS